MVSLQNQNLLHTLIFLNKNIFVISRIFGHIRRGDVWSYQTFFWFILFVVVRNTCFLTLPHTSCQHYHSLSAPPQYHTNFKPPRDFCLPRGRHTFPRSLTPSVRAPTRHRPHDKVFHQVTDHGGSVSRDNGQQMGSYFLGLI